MVTCGKSSGTQDLKRKLLSKFVFFLLVSFIGMASLPRRPLGGYPSLHLIFSHVSSSVVTS